MNENLDIDHDWFTGKIPTWLRAFEKENFKQNKKIRCLEIGSFQGLSAFFTLHHFPNAQ